MAARLKVTNHDISPEQIRAARALLDWSRKALADATGAITERTVARVELQEVASEPATLAAIRITLEKAGVSFIAENGGGPGVRLKKRKAKR